MEWCDGGKEMCRKEGVATFKYRTFEKLGSNSLTVKLNAVNVPEQSLPVKLIPQHHKSP